MQRLPSSACAKSACARHSHTPTQLWSSETTGVQREGGCCGDALDVAHGREDEGGGNQREATDKAHDGQELRDGNG